MELGVPEIRTAGEDKAMKVISGAHCIDNDIGERAGVETFNLDMLAEGSEVTIESTQFCGTWIVIGVLRWWFGNGSTLIGWRVVCILRVFHDENERMQQSNAEQRRSNTLCHCLCVNYYDDNNTIELECLFAVAACTSIFNENVLSCDCESSPKQVSYIIAAAY